MDRDTSFARLVSLACHDLRTPLATVHGFARTLVRMDGIEEPASRYLEMIDAASDQLRELLDDLGLVARIESGRYEPGLREVDTLELARLVGSSVGDGEVAVTGDGTSVQSDPHALERALHGLVRCAIRHGGIARLDVRVDGARLTLSPIAESAAPVLTTEELRDLGAAVASRVLPALGGSMALDGDTLVVRLERGDTEQ